MIGELRAWWDDSGQYLTRQAIDNCAGCDDEGHLWRNGQIRAQCTHRGPFHDATLEAILAAPAYRPNPSP